MQVRMVLVGSVLWMIVGCGGSAPPPAQPAPAPPQAVVEPAPAPAPAPAPPAVTSDDTPMTAAEALTEMTRFRDQMCSCRDKPCADQVTASMVRWSERMTHRPHDEYKVSDDETRRLAEVTESLTRCMTTALGGGSGD